MGEPSDSDSISNDCLICAKIGCSSELSSELGYILKVIRGISTLKTASVERADGLSQYLNTREFVYVHSTKHFRIRSYGTQRKSYLSGRVFNCRPRGARFKPGCPYLQGSEEKYFLEIFEGGDDLSHSVYF
ncbi:hypothetical protein TNCV_3348251 [Trichonephila clavipes]|nr:hypothetical protein TNCV_3348251 [Trichonephila clavipes]